MQNQFLPKFYVDKNGKYLGQFSGYIVEATAEKPRHMVYATPDDVDAIEVETPPEDGLQLYDIENKKWLPL